MVDQVKSLWALLKTDRRGVTAMEYGIIAGLVSVVLVTAFATFGTALTAGFTTMASHITG